MFSGEVLEMVVVKEGRLRVSYEITDGVDTSVDEIELVIDDVPDVSFSSISMADGCEGEEVLAYVSGLPNASSFTWSNAVGASISSQAGQNAV